MSAPPVAADHRVERAAQPGPAGNVFAAHYVYTHAPADAEEIEWNAVHIIDNHSDAGQNCATYAQGRGYGRGPTWALCAEVADLSFGAGNASLVAGEFDVWCCGPSNGRRIGVHAVVGDAKAIHGGQAYAGACEGEHAFLASSNGSHARWRIGAALRDWTHAGISIEGDGGEFGVRLLGAMVVGIDFTGMDYRVQSVIRLRDNQWIALEGTDTVRLGYTSGLVTIAMAGQPIFQLDIHTGDLYLKGQVRRMGEP